MAAGSRRWHRCVLGALLGLIPAASAWSAASCAQRVLEELAAAEKALEEAFERWEYLESLKNGE